MLLFHISAYRISLQWKAMLWDTAKTFRQVGKSTIMATVKEQDLTPFRHTHTHTLLLCP